MNWAFLELVLIPRDMGERSWFSRVMIFLVTPGSNYEGMVFCQNLFLCNFYVFCCWARGEGETLVVLDSSVRKGLLFALFVDLRTGEAILRPLLEAAISRLLVAWTDWRG